MDKRCSSRRPRVISIPVHFVQSEQTQSASALKIQKAFRGFLVRKSVKHIKTILRQVVEIEKRIESVDETGRIDEKKRLRLNETLMSLLLRLDSVRGICNGVRDCRKRVIKKAIALQEKVDSISSSTVVSEIVSDEERVAVEDPTKVDTIASEIVSDEERVAVDQDATKVDTVASEIVPDQVQIEFEERKEIAIALPEEEDITVDEDRIAVEEEKSTMAIKEDSTSEINPEQFATTEVEEEPKTIHCFMEEGRASPECGDEMINEYDDESGGMNPEVDVDVRNEKDGQEKERKRSRDLLLEKMADENEKLLGMMKELNEKNELQMRLLNSLAQRVELLEKTVVCDKLARLKKKKRFNNNNF